MGAHFCQHRLGVGTQNAVDGSRHAQVGDVARPLGQHAGVGGGDVGVGAENDIDPPVQMVAHGQLLRGSLGVEVQEGDVIVPLLAVEDAIHHREGVVQRIHEGRTRQIHAEDTEAAVLHRGVAHTGAGGGVVGGADDTVGVVVQVAVNVPTSEGVVAQGDEIHPAVQKSLGIPQGKTVDLGGVLSVADHQIGPQGGSGLAELVRQILNGAAAHYVADGKDFHGDSLFYARAGGISNLGLAGSWVSALKAFPCKGRCHALRA